MAMYFGKDVDEQIIAFNTSKDPEERKKIFEKGIKTAFMKLIDSQIYLYRFYKIDDAQQLRDECLSNLYEILPKFDASKGKKGFSYFNVVAKNWFICKIREKKKRQKQEAENFYGIDHEVVKNNPSVILSSYEDEITDKEFWVVLFRNMSSWEELIRQDPNPRAVEQEIKVLRAITFILQNPHLVTIYNKKAVYFYICEMTGLTMKQVNHNMGKLKSRYEAFKERFHSGEEG